MSAGEVHTWQPDAHRGLYCYGRGGDTSQPCSASLAQHGNFTDCPSASSRHLLVVARCYPDQVEVGGLSYDRSTLIRGLAYLDAVGMLLWLLGIAYLAKKEK